MGEKSANPGGVSRDVHRGRGQPRLGASAGAAANLSRELTAARQGGGVSRPVGGVPVSSHRRTLRKKDPRALAHPSPAAVSR